MYGRRPVSEEAGKGSREERRSGSRRGSGIGREAEAGERSGNRRGVSGIGRGSEAGEKWKQ